MSKKACVALVTVLLASLVAVAYAAPSGKIYFDPEGQVSSADNVLLTGGSEEFTIRFKNDAGADITSVASTLQYIKLAAADTNPTRAQIGLTATWKIFDPSSVERASGTVPGIQEDAIYSPYSTTDTVYLYTWALGKPSPTLDAYTDPNQIDPAHGGDSTLRVLRPQEFLDLTITIQCQGIVGDSRIWFFFIASEAAYALPYPTDITTIDPTYDTQTSKNRVNLYYSTVPRISGGPFWLPLHNSYDPYDSDIGTGHNFDQHSWTRGATTTSFAKANKLVHQKPPENPGGDGAATFSFHICGTKFLDLNGNGVYDPESEPGIGLFLGGTWLEPGVTVRLLAGVDLQHLQAATQYYTELSYPPPEDASPDILASGENSLRGSYCFNLVGALGAKAYNFYIEIEGQLIGPISLIAGEDGPRESLNNNFRNAVGVVGGTTYAVNALALLSPYLALFGVFVAVAVFVAVPWKKSED